MRLLGYTISLLKEKKQTNKFITKGTHRYQSPVFTGHWETVQNYYWIKIFKTVYLLIIAKSTLYRNEYYR